MCKSGGKAVWPGVPPMLAKILNPAMLACALLLLSRNRRPCPSPILLGDAHRKTLEAHLVKIIVYTIRFQIIIHCVKLFNVMEGCSPRIIFLISMQWSVVYWNYFHFSDYINVWRQNNIRRSTQIMLADRNMRLHFHYFLFNNTT